MQSSKVIKHIAKSFKKSGRSLSQPNLDSVHQNSESKMLLPKMKHDLKTNKIMVSKRESEYLGVKYHLGHTAYLPRSIAESTKNKMYLTKSSIAINRLRDLMQITDNIEYKLKSLQQNATKDIKDAWLVKSDVNWK